ncbi:MAG TPA: hypothetical protein IAB18_02010 [Candidatus Avisuccinivibrio pullicola]|nr:hypothetical protein [Candidatus Avisuccinivibrio pullicola]
MGRRKSVQAIEMKISKVQSRIHKTKDRYDKLCDELKGLIEERDEAQGSELLAALKSSGKTYREVMTFLGK